MAQPDDLVELQGHPEVLKGKRTRHRADLDQPTRCDVVQDALAGRLDTFFQDRIDVPHIDWGVRAVRIVVGSGGGQRSIVTLGLADEYNLVGYLELVALVRPAIGVDRPVGVLKGPGDRPIRRRLVGLYPVAPPAITP